MGGNKLPLPSHERTDNRAKHCPSVADTGALYEAALIIAVYAIVFILIAAFRLLKSDVTKKTG
jgi:hypothetical protein